MRNVHYEFSGDNTITGTVVSKGETFTATAKLCPGDKYSEELGKLIVKYRLEIKQRRRDLRNTEEVIKRLKEIYADEHNTKDFSEISKHWMRFIQDASEERKSQLENIAFAKTALEVLSQCDGKVETMIRRIVKKHYSDERTIGLLIALVNLVGLQASRALIWQGVDKDNRDNAVEDEKLQARLDYLKHVKKL